MDNGIMHDHGREVLQHAGVPYVDYLARTAESKPAKSYLEIGTQTGASLSRIACTAIAIDPEFRLKFDPMGKKPGCFLFQMTSDDFFTVCDPKAMLGRPVDVAFLDGMHLFEYLLRDFMNTEKACKANSIVFLHDCLPPVFEIAGREDKPVVHNRRFLHHWAGDVWKLIPILQRYRPDLHIRYLDCPPTGLVAISNCDPRSTVLRDAYNTIVSDFAEKANDDQLFFEVMAGIRLTASRRTASAAELLSELTPA